MLEKLKAKLDEAKAKSEELFDSIKLPKEIRDERLTVCLSCEHLLKPTNNCKKCGCFMDLKTWLPGSSCPIGKWESVNTTKESAIN